MYTFVMISYVEEKESGKGLAHLASGQLRKPCQRRCGLVVDNADSGRRGKLRALGNTHDGRERLTSCRSLDRRSRRLGLGLTGSTIAAWDSRNRDHLTGHRGWSCKILAGGGAAMVVVVVGILTLALAGLGEATENKATSNNAGEHKGTRAFLVIQRSVGALARRG